MQRLLHQYMRMLTRYNEWATARLYECCAGLDEAAYRRRPAGDGRNLHDLLDARLADDKRWLTRLKGYAPAGASAEEDMHDAFEPLRDAQLAQDVALADYVHGLAEEDLLRPVSYEEETGETRTNTQYELLTHLVASQIHGRAQAAQLIEGSGASPPDLEVLRFIRETYVGTRALRG